MNKIMELVRRVLVSESNEDLNLIQAEVTRLEAEAEQLKNTASYWHEMSEANGAALLVALAERDELQRALANEKFERGVIDARYDELRAKLAALEVQKPVAIVRKCRIKDVIINGNNDEISVNLPPGTRLYLAVRCKAMTYKLPKPLYGAGAYPFLGRVNGDWYSGDQMQAAYAAGLADGAPKWSPIESAPNDNFLAYLPNERTKIQTATYHPKVKIIGNSFVFDLSKPTHWMPLPAAPEPKP